MKQHMFEKIIRAHHVSGDLVPGKEVSISIDQTLTQDSLGVMSYLQFEAIGEQRVKTELSVSYIDHLLLQLGEGNGDVHRYLETVADRFGVVYSKPGNGICHHIHLERFGVPGKTLIGGDSHTVTCGALGMAAFGVGGLDVTMAMAGMPFYLSYPKVLRVNLTGELRDWCTAKDVILEVLRRITTKGNTGVVLEYAGPALSNLTVPQRATIANMGAETGVTTSIFPSDEMTLRFLTQQGRSGDFVPLCSDPGTEYEEEINIDLSQLEPLVALPHSPDNVTSVAEVQNLHVDQVMIGSCTNSSYQDMMRAALILRGKKVAPHVHLGVSCGSRQIFSMLSKSGALSWMIDAGARILENGCGFCVGQGQAPQLNGVSVRTSNRNFKGRSGTQDAQVYLVSPEVAAATAITGKLTDPRTLSMKYPSVDEPSETEPDDSMLLFPTGKKEIYRSRIIGEPPFNTAMPEELNGEVAIKVGDKINTDDIIPAGEAMTYRANIKKSCEFIFQFIDNLFPATCERIVKEGRIPVIVAGESYGQGSSREHAALCPMYMGVRFLVAKSYERIHMANLINFGILPLQFENPDDYNDIERGNVLTIDTPHSTICQDVFPVHNRTKGRQYLVLNRTSDRQRNIVLRGGLLNAMVMK